MKKKFKCHCGNDKFSLSVHDKSYYKTNPRKTLLNRIILESFPTKIYNYSLTSSCSSCDQSWSSYDSLADLQKVMIEAGVLI